jgi:hypothetical protein
MLCVICRRRKKSCMISWARLKNYLRGSGDGYRLTGIVILNGLKDRYGVCEECKEFVDRGGRNGNV